MKKLILLLAVMLPLLAVAQPYSGNVGNPNTVYRIYGQLQVDSIPYTSVYRDTVLVSVGGKIRKANLVQVVNSGGGGASDGNNYLSGLTYNQATRNLTASRIGLSSISVNIPTDTIGLRKYSDSLFASIPPTVNITGNAATVTNGVYTSGTYSNPSWISSLAWSKITGSPTLATIATSGLYSDLISKPTTLSGYGITDAYPLSGNPSGFLTAVPAQSFSSLTGKPTTLSGYGITDAYSSSNPSGYTSNTGTVTNVTGSAPISVATGTTTPAITIATANTSTTGALSFTDWNTFNGKQSALSGTGFIKASGSTISYDNSTYLTTASAASTYYPTTNPNGYTTNTGTVTSASVVSANGISGSVATATTTPAITLSLGAITPTSIVASGTISGSNLSGTNTGDQTTITGNAATATKLQTARLINGVSFDGSADITIAGSGSGTVSSGTANTLSYYSASGTTVSPLTAITASRALASNASGLPVASTTTSTELGYVNGVTSAIQTQINVKAPIASPTFTGAVQNTVTSQAAASSLVGVVANNSFIGAGSYGVGNYYPNYVLYTTDNNATVPKYAEIVQISGTGTFKFWYTSANYAATPDGVVSMNPSGALGVGNTGAAASSMLEVTSTTKGFLPPRMTKTQRNAITSPATGLVIYQTDNTPGLRCYNGTSWMRYTETAD